MDDLAAFVHDTDAAALPREVVEHAKFVMLDTIGVMLAASVISEPTKLAAEVNGTEQGGTATLLRRGFPRVTPASAAFVNGSTAVFLEMDEGHRYFTTHAAVHVLPAALAMAKHVHASGADLIAALVVGYDVAARTGGATRARAIVNGHGTWGTVGAAAACAKLARLGAAETALAIGIGAHLALATSSRAPLQGATVRNVYVGHAGEAGVRAVQLARAGFMPLDDAAAEIFGRILGDDFNARVLTDQLGTRFEITRNFFKLYACCQWNHATLDALEEVLANAPISEADIESIDIATFFPASEMNSTRPLNSLQAKFSLPYAVAARVVFGHAGPDAFSNSAIRDALVLSLAERVAVTADGEMTAGFPSQRSSRVRLRTRDGREQVAHCANARGDFLRPHPRAALLAKYSSLAAQVLTADGVLNIERMIGRLESLADVNELTEAMRHATSLGCA